jgi:hypothetical protein
MVFLLGEEKICLISGMVLADNIALRRGVSSIYF